MTSRSKGQLAYLWQLPLLLLSLVLFSLSGYFALDSNRGLTVARRMDIAQSLIDQERPQAAMEELRRLMAGEKLHGPDEAGVRLLIGAAMHAAQKQSRTNIAIDHSRIIEETQVALSLGATPTADVHRRLGESYEELGQLAEALGHYRQAMSLDSSRQLFWRRKIIEVELSQPGGGAALALIDEYLREKGLADSERAWAIGHKAELLADRGDFLGARALINEALRLESDPIGQAQANYRRAYCEWRLGKTAEAERLAKSAREQFRNQHPLDADAAFLLARIAQEREDYAQSAALYDEVVTQHAEWRLVGAARVGRAICRVLAGDSNAGARELGELTALVRSSSLRGVARDDVVSTLRLAQQALALRGEDETLLQLLEHERTIVEVLPVSFYQRLTSALERRAEMSRDERVARDMLVRAADAHVEASRLLYQAGKADHAGALWDAIALYERAGETKRAIEVMEHVVRDRPEDAMASELLLKLGETHQSLGATARALEIYETLRQKYGGSDPAKKVGLPLAMAYLAQGQDHHRDAERVLVEIIDRREGGSWREATFELGRLYYRAAKYEQAIARLVQLARNSSGDDRLGQVYFMLGDCHRRLALQTEMEPKTRRLAEARTWYDRAIERYASHRPSRDADANYEKLSHLHRADCAYELGSYEEAITLYEATAQRFSDDATSLAAYVQVVNSYCALGRREEAKAASARASALVARMPADAFSDGGFVMPRAYWEQWLKWTSTASAW